MRRVLWISPFLPWPLHFGGGIRVFHLMRLGSERFDVTLACLLGGGESPDREVPAPIASLVAATKFFPRRYSYRGAQAQALVRGGSHHRLSHMSPGLDAWMAANAGGFDAIVAEFTQMAWLHLPDGPRRVLDLHNIEAELLRRTAEKDPKAWRRWWRARDARFLEREERDVCRRYDLVAVPSQREVDVMGGWDLPGRLAAIPNGVDTGSFARPLTAEEEQLAADCPDIVYIGTMQYYPNEEAVLHFAGEIWPRIRAARPATTFGVIGGHPKPSVSRLADASFRILGMVPEIRPFFHRARLLAVPLLSGGGTRLKILEACASGTPIVTTSLGCEGIDLEHGRHALIADDPPSFARACLDVLEQPAAAAARAAAARQLVRDRYDWRPVGGRFADLIEEAIDRPRMAKP